MKLRRHYDLAVDSVRDGLFRVLVFVGIVWGVFLLDLGTSQLAGFELNRWLDLHPREARGLVGIVTMPLAETPAGVEVPEPVLEEVVGL